MPTACAFQNCTCIVAEPGDVCDTYCDVACSVDNDPGFVRTDKRCDCGHRECEGRTRWMGAFTRKR